MSTRSTRRPRATRRPHRGVTLAVLIACGVLLTRTGPGSLASGLFLTALAGADIRNPQSVVQAAIGSPTPQSSPTGTPSSTPQPAPPTAELQWLNPVQTPHTAYSWTVLIYHTHTTEAYTQQPGQPYTPSDEWRTEDNNYNVVRVGSELQQALQQQGLQVWHATTNHEPPRLGTAYTRSLITMQQAAQNTQIGLFIDLHRDAYTQALHPIDTVMVNGQPAARMMFVVAKGEGYDPSPDWQTNLALAQSITDQVNAKYPDLMSQPMLRQDRYNQHMGLSLLVEVGHNRNTLDQALAAIGPLAEAIGQAAPLIDQLQPGKAASPTPGAAASPLPLNP